jgi:hypothetical protein
MCGDSQPAAPSAGPTGCAGGDGDHGRHGQEQAGCSAPWPGRAGRPGRGPPDLVAYDSGIDGGGASAEEAAVHVVDEEPGEDS